MQGGNGGQQGLPGAWDMGRGKVWGDAQTSLGWGLDHGEQRSHSVLSGKTKLCLQICRVQELNPAPDVSSFSSGIHLGCCVLRPWHLAGLVSWTVITGQWPAEVQLCLRARLLASVLLISGAWDQRALSQWRPVRASMMRGVLLTHKTSQWPPR